MLNEILNSVADVFKSDNGPAYAGTLGIVLIMCFRYGYKFIGNGVSIEPILPNIPIRVGEEMDTIEENLVNKGTAVE